MTAQLYLAANLVQSSLIFGHLQVVYENENGNLSEAEATSPDFPYFFGNWAYPDFGRRHDDTANTPGYEDPDDYAIVPIALLPGQSAEYVWDLLGQVHKSLSTGNYGIDYDVNQNSNSYATTLLLLVGIETSPYLDTVTPASVEAFPGATTDVLQGAKTGGLFSGYDTPIPLTLEGTRGNDYIKTGIGNDLLRGARGQDSIHAGAGNDDVRGGSGDDLIFGDAGNDRLRGNNGDDTVNGGAGSDTIIGKDGNDILSGGDGDDLIVGHQGNDVLLGGAGNDRLDGRSGNDVMSGGDGADTFLFNSKKDEILDFEDDIDTVLIAAKHVDGNLSGQEIIDTYGKYGDGHAVLQFGRHELKFIDVTDLQILADDILIY